MISSRTNPRISNVRRQGIEGEEWRPLDSEAKTFVYAFGFFRAAQRAFINADNFFLAAALIEGRLLAFLGADFPFHLPNAVSSLPKFVCGRRRSCADVDEPWLQRLLAGGHGEELMNRRFLGALK